MLMLFSDNVAREVLREFLPYDLKKNGESHLERTIMLISKLDVWMATVVSYLVKKKKTAGYFKTEYATGA